MSKLDKVLETVGPPLKARETWVSSIFFIHFGGDPIRIESKETFSG